MTPDAEFHREFAEMRNKVGELDGTVRVVKHSVANMQMAQQGIAARFDKLEERIGDKIDTLSDKVSAINTQQARGVGFFAGIAAVIMASGAVLVFLGKLLFGAH